jgi:hypothetical protein
MPNDFRRALRVALCYVLALQAFAAAVSTARAVDLGSGIDVGAIICHSSGGDTRPGDAGKSPNVPCALCVIAASAVSLPDPLSIMAQPTAVAGCAWHRDVPVLAKPPARAGLARAPPQFA